MDKGTADRRAHYLAKIKEAEAAAAKSTNPETIDELQTLIVGYHRLLDHLPPVTGSEN